MTQVAAIWPVARGSLALNRVRYLVMALLLGLAVAAYLLYTTFMTGANVEANLAMEEYLLPADIVFLGRAPLYPAVIDDWAERGGVVEVAALRQARYVTEYGSLRVIAAPGDSPVWAAATATAVTVGSQQAVKLREGEILLPPALYQRHKANVADPSTLAMLIPGERAAAARHWVVAGAHSATDAILKDCALILLDDAGPFANSMFIWTRGKSSTNSLVALLELEFLGPKRPILQQPDDPAVYHSRSASNLAAGILGQTYMPGFSIMTMIFVFSGIGLLTVSSLAFLDRKRDLAILKTVGMENTGVVALVLVEQSAIAVVGLLFGITVGGAAIAQLSVHIPASQGLTAVAVVKAVIAGLFIQGLGVIVPALTARIATVNQLLYNLPVPLYYRRVYQSEV